MTPAERARLIDEQEFKAECEALRERAFDLFEKKRRDDEIRWQRLNHPEIEEAERKQASPVQRNTFTRSSSKLHTFNGQSKTTTEWAEIVGITRSAFVMRLRSGMSLERAITMQPGERPAGKSYTLNGDTKSLSEWADQIGITPAALYKRLKTRSLADALNMKGRVPKAEPGVSLDFEGSKGTGGGSTTQAIPEITFSKQDETA